LSIKLRDAVAQLSCVPRALGLVWAAAPSWTLSWGSLLVIQGLLPVATVYLTRMLVDSLVVAVRTHGSWSSMRPTLVVAGLMICVTLLMEFLESTIEWIRSAQSEFIRDHISALVHEKSASVDIAFYESPEYHDHLYRVRDEANSYPLALLESVGSLLQNSVTLLAMGSVLIPYGGWVPLLLLVSILPALYVVLSFNWRNHQWWEQTTSNRRWAMYYDDVLVDNDVAAELRVFGLGAHFQSAYSAFRRGLRTQHLRLLKKQSLGRLGAGTAALLISGAAMAWMVWRALRGAATLGDLALFYQAFQRGQSLMRSLLGDVGKIYSNTLFLGNLFEFLDLKPQVLDPPIPVPAPSVLGRGICFRQVTFRYPGSNRMALQHFNLAIPAGQTTAIVGPNGAGKSTLVKLLCRFYDPEGGSIELDGINLRDITIAELRRVMTVLFQSPVHYHATAAQNIALGNLWEISEPVEVETAARAAGAHDLITSLPKGYETLLGKWFAEGTELSEGEWQRIALARAYLRRAHILILDEPTSHMDPWAEVDWLERFHALARGRTAVIITHRFTVAMHADVIHVMHEGQIVESGTHQQLLTRSGLYAESWAAQVSASPLSPV
jgi:ATP-binding cassette, subfamily B, bacterial